MLTDTTQRGLQTLAGEQHTVLVHHTKESHMTARTIWHAWLSHASGAPLLPDQRATSRRARDTKESHMMACTHGTRGCPTLAVRLCFQTSELPRGGRGTPKRAT